MDESNYYEDKQNRQFLDDKTEKNKHTGDAKINKKEKLKKEESQKEKLARTANEVGTDIAVGMFGGGLGAAVFGRYSLLAGIIVSGWGHYVKNKYIAKLGLGLMSSSSMTAVAGVKQDPKASMIENAQERVKAFGQELQRKLFLDKLTGSKLQAPVQKQLNGFEKNTEPPTPAHFDVEPQAEKNYIKSEDVINAKISFNENEEIGYNIKKGLYDDYDVDFKNIEERLF